VNPLPAPLPVPSVNIISQPACSTSTGSFSVINPIGIQLEYSLNGINWQASANFNNISPGTYRVTARNTVSGCSSTSQDIIIDPPPPIPTAPTVVSPIGYCQFATGVPALTASGSNLLWYTIAAGGTGQSNAPVPGTAVPGSTTWFVSQTNAQGCESARTPITVVVEALPTVSTTPKRTEIMLGQTANLNGTVTGQNLTIRWSPTSGVSNPGSAVTTARPGQTTTYRLTATSPRGCTASDTVRVVVIREIIVPNVFSPNGDGTNDRWVIKYIEDYPSALVEVFNRYGQLLFSNKRNGQQWDGTVNGQPVPVGAYFYVINLGNNKVFKGTISVVR
jgi:gliding motility-associated-like protein